MFCPKCGKQMPENGVCPDCNSNPNPTPDPVVEPVVNPTPNPYANPNPNPYTNPNPNSYANGAANPYFNANNGVYGTVTPVVPQMDPGKQQGTASMILGIVALVLGTLCSCLFACLGGAVPFICAIVGIVLSVQATNKSRDAGFGKNGRAQAGMIMSIVAMVVIVIFVIVNAVLGGMMAASM